MLKTLLTLAAALMPVFAGMSWSFDARAADTDIPRTNLDRLVKASPNCRDLRLCGPAGCDWRRVCTRPCPDSYSCYPLYGAYGPYGGGAYWASYSHGGWGYGR